MQIDLAKYWDMLVPRNTKKKIDLGNLHAKTRVYDKVSPRFFSSMNFHQLVSSVKKNIKADYVLRMIESVINWNYLNIIWFEINKKKLSSYS